MPLRITLQQKYITTIICLLLTLAISLSLLYVHFFHKMMETTRNTDRQNIERSQYQQLNTIGNTYALMLADNLVNPVYQYDLNSIQQLLQTTLKQPQINFVEILEPNGEILHDGKKSIPTFGTIPDDPQLAKILKSKTLVSHTWDNQLIIAAPVLLNTEPIAFIRLGLSLQTIKEKSSLIIYQSQENENINLQNALKATLVLTIVIAALFLLIAILIGQNLVRPIRRLVRSAEMVGQGDFQPITITSNDEIGDLSTAFNNMLNYLNKTTISRDHLDSIIKSLSELLIVTNADKKITLINPAACKILGYEASELIGYSISLILPHELNIALDNAKNNQEISSDYPHCKEYYLRTKDYRLIDVEIDKSIIKGHQGEEREIIYVAQDIRERKKQNIIRKKAEKKIHQLAYYDKLTGLPNRTLFYDRLHQALNQLDRQHQKLALLYLDLDRFKFINDTNGHNVGDDLLRAVSQRLSTCLRETDTLARLGGDEFAILLCNLEHNLSVSKVAGKIKDCFKKPFLLGHQHIYTDTSIGISISPDDTTSVETLIKNADVAMYHAKNSNHESFCFYTKELNSKIQQQIILNEGLISAVKHQSEFHLLYQIQADISTLQAIRLETLLRWKHPIKGFIPPKEFIPVAEENGTITEIGYWVIEQVCRDWVKWNDLNQHKLILGINISARQLKDKNFVSRVQSILQKYAMNPHYIEFEFSEDLLREVAFEKPLKALYEIGINLSIDDFGTGFSSLSYLNKFHIRTLKIDKSFIKKIAYDNESKSITDSIIALGHSLGLKIVAEGIEQQTQLEILQESKCDFVQGYYINKPTSVNKLIPLLRDSTVKVWASTDLKN